MSIRVMTTLDQSHTLYNEALDETYHSRNGAVEESLYVFLKQGLEKAAETKKEIRILEIGFGTGLNAILTLVACERMQLLCHYHSLETYPLQPSLISTLNYTGFVEPDYHDLFRRMHEVEWNTLQPITDFFHLQKIEQSIHDYVPKGDTDLIYFDAFGPDKQPDMWTGEVFAKMFAALKPGGILVTYSSKGDVKRGLHEAGFEVQRLPGPPKKRHMLRAVKPV